MRISKETLSVLKNFRDLNSNIYVSPGSVIKTITPAKNVMAEAVVKEDFPVPFGLWDLGSFLGTISLFDDPDFSFEEKCVVISNGNSRVKYHYSEPSLLTVPTKNVNMPETVVSVDLSEDQFNELKRAGAVLGLSDLSFVSDNSDITATLFDKSGANNNTYSIKIENAHFDEGVSFNYDFKIDNLRFIPGSYVMNLAEKTVCEFVNSNSSVTYWVALEGTSAYNAAETLNAGVS